MTPLTLSIATLREASACDFDARIKRLTDEMGRRPDDDEEIWLRKWWQTTPDPIDRMWSLTLFGDSGWDAAYEVCIRAVRRAIPLLDEREQPGAEVLLNAIIDREPWNGDGIQEYLAIKRASGQALRRTGGGDALGRALYWGRNAPASRAHLSVCLTRATLSVCLIDATACHQTCQSIVAGPEQAEIDTQLADVSELYDTLTDPSR